MRPYNPRVPHHPLAEAPIADLSRELAVATSAARAAGELQMERYERLERIVHKSEHDVVTEVDHLSEELILGRLREAFPADDALAEESGASPRSREQATHDAVSGRMWIVDPLDGTVNYANGIPVFCVSIGLAIGGSPALGVIYDPARRELFSAITGAGACLDGKPIGVPVKERLSDCVVSLSLPGRGYARRSQALRRAIRVSRVLGSASLSLAYVANGRFDAFVQLRGLSLWDVAAAGVIATEGGARVTDAAGGAWFDVKGAAKSIGTVAAAPVHHAAIMKILA